MFYKSIPSHTACRRGVDVNCVVPSVRFKCILTEIAELHPLFCIHLTTGSLIDGKYPFPCSSIKPAYWKLEFCLEFGSGFLVASVFRTTSLFRNKLRLVERLRIFIG